jgi:prepilin-type N-terminal cleavage/methylation domain-containing protein
MPRNQKGFTLMELVVVTVIVAILAAVAVPLYINYVRDAQESEARGAIGAVITAQQSYFQGQRGGYGTNYAPTLQALKDAGDLDITEAEVNWTFATAGTGSGPTAGFTVRADGRAARPAARLFVTYRFTRTGGGEWDY